MGINSSLNSAVIESVRKRFDFLNKYNEVRVNAYRINEGMFDTDMSGWINIGIIKNASPFGAGGDAYLMVNPNYPQTNDFKSFRYRATGYNTKKDGTGNEISGIPTYKQEYLEIYPEFRDTYYGEIFLGRKKTDEEIKKHEQFMLMLNTVEDKVILMHDSNYKITDGVVKKGVANGYSNNSDIGIYFWGSNERGSDQSNGSKYTYYCLVDKDYIYDFENDIERIGTLRNVFNTYAYAAQFWQGGPSIVVNTLTPTPISYIRDNSNGKVYGNNWQEIRK